jgi:hypothetical protein
MIDFFKNIFNNPNNKKAINSTSDDFNRLYLDRNKQIYIQIKLTTDLSCQDIHSYYHNEILEEIMKNNQNQINKVLNLNEFSFLIIDSENIYTEIKLKLKDYPFRFMKKRSINLYYINTNEGLKAQENKNNDKIQTLNEGNLNSIINNSEECIREGELLKYSFKHKRFDKRTVILDKEKLIIIRAKTKNQQPSIYNIINIETTILYLTDINAILREISENSIIDKFTFEINTFEGERFVFKSKCNADLESWMEAIYLLMSLVRDNKHIIKFSEMISKVTKESYEKEMKIIFSCLSLKGLLSIKETRAILYK